MFQTYDPENTITKYKDNTNKLWKGITGMEKEGIKLRYHF